FFGGIGCYILKKFFDNLPGLIVSDEGIFDNASGISAGFIPWTDILAMTETTVVNSSFINVIVKNPQDYIDKQKSAFKRKMMKLNYKSYGSVITIQANGLNCTYPKLKALLENSFEEFKSKKNPHER
ncbi:MAG: STM3941 family protein, partial [Bacteroidia bacterium]